MRIVFAQPRHKYDSYTDFRKLVELSEFESVYFDEIDRDAEDTTYIVSPLNNSFPRWSGKAKARFVYWNLERPDVESAPFWELPGLAVHASVSSALTQFDEVWVSDRHFASIDKRLKHAVLASHEGLAEGPLHFHVYDYCHMSYVWGRREHVIVPLRVSLREGPNGWGAERARVLRSSRFMVNVHQTAAPIMEPLRFALAAAYRLPMVSEAIKDPWPLVPGEDYLQLEYDKMAAEIVKLPNSLAPWLNMADNLHRKLCVDRTFRSEVIAAVEGVAGA